MNQNLSFAVENSQKINETTTTQMTLEVPKLQTRSTTKAAERVSPIKGNSGCSKPKVKTNDIQADIKKIYQLISKLDNDNSKVLHSLDHINNNINRINENINTINIQISKLNEENKLKDEKIKDLENKVIEITRKNKSEIDEKINKLDQRNIINNVEILNVPESCNNAREAVLEIARASNYAISNSDIVDAYRTKTKKKIIAKFSSLIIKREFMKRARVSNLKAADITNIAKTTQNKNNNNNNNNKNIHSNKKIYVNEQLTEMNNKLFWNARKKAKEINWKFVWVTEGKIMMKKDESSSITYISKISDIVSLT